MWSRLSAKSKRNSVWLISNSASNNLLDLHVDGTAETRASSLYDPVSNPLVGREILTVEGLSVLGSLGDVILADLSALRYVLTQDGKIQLESKDDTRKRLGRSPDRADAVAMACLGTDGLRGPRTCRIGHYTF